MRAAHCRGRSGRGKGGRLYRYDRVPALCKARDRVAQGRGLYGIAGLLSCRRTLQNVPQLGAYPPFLYRKPREPERRCRCARRRRCRRHGRVCRGVLPARRPARADPDDASRRGGFFRRRENGGRSPDGEKPHRGVLAAVARYMRYGHAPNASGRRPARRLRRDHQIRRAGRRDAVLQAGEKPAGRNTGGYPRPLRGDKARYRRRR